MKKVLVSLVMVLMGFLLMVPGAIAYPVAAGDYIVATFEMGNANGGGSFNIDKVGDNAGVLFDTFCVEKSETFTPGQPLYIGSITNNAILGGTGSFDPLDSESAYLMYQWATGAITHTAGNANALQAAIWFIEDAAALPAGLATTYYNNALNNHDGSLYGVQVMNLYGEMPVTGGVRPYAQDMLVYNPVPEPATLFLLGLGLVGVAGVKRKFNK